MRDLPFKKGAEVEISSNDVGFRGSWYIGTVVQPASKKNKTIVVEYKNLMADEDGTKPLRETVDVLQLRPPPPREHSRTFSFNEEVDAFHHDGWWEGVITRDLGDGRFSVYFRSSREQIEFEQSELRLHREWVSGKWVPEMEEEEEEVQTTTEGKSCRGKIRETFKKGTLVEVGCDEDGFEGSWFTATIVRPTGKGRYLVEYQKLKTEDGKGQLREEVLKVHIRPQPPVLNIVGRFGMHEEVDAQYNDGWWVGVISEVLKGSKYKVYFKSTKELIEFKHSDLRRHQDWVDGKWIIGSQVGDESF